MSTTQKKNKKQSASWLRYTTLTIQKPAAAKQQKHIDLDNIIQTEKILRQRHGKIQYQITKNRQKKRKKPLIHKM